MAKFVRETMKRFESEGGVWDDAEQCIHVSSPHLLTQISGYVKHVLGSDGTAVFYRGQSKIYSTMLPALYRPLPTGPKSIRITARHSAINDYLQSVKKAEAFLRGVPDEVYEPLLQHYGIRTRWLDVVDNIWVSLWFSCFSALGSGDQDQFLHFERRSTASANQYAYILLLAIEGVAPTPKAPGFSKGGNIIVADLRVAAPSLYIRPHAQHGVVIRANGVNTASDADLAAHVAGVIRVGLADALTWLGNGDLLTTHTLFPPPYYDQGYRRLLELAPKAPPILGSITAVGA